MAFVDFKYFSPVMGMQMNLNIILPEVMQGIGVEEMCIRDRVYSGAARCARRAHLCAGLY